MPEFSVQVLIILYCVLLIIYLSECCITFLSFCLSFGSEFSDKLQFWCKSQAGQAALLVCFLYSMIMRIRYISTILKCYILLAAKSHLYQYRYFFSNQFIKHSCRVIDCLGTCIGWSIFYSSLLQIPFSIVFNCWMSSL